MVLDVPRYTRFQTEIGVKDGKREPCNWRKNKKVLGLKLESEKRKRSNERSCSET